jgi:glycolate oxidase FAD binding subunit
LTTADMPRVVEPADAAEVARLLKDASERGETVLPRGGGTKTGWANPAWAGGLVLSTSRLNQIVEHAWADLTVTVQPGCTIAALQSALELHGQRVAVDPLWLDRATVGGVLSANDTGGLRLRFGGLRDLIIGTTLALADGTLASSGGKVVKNVAGYDLSKLATGAFGTLGVITRATFRLHPIAQMSRTCSAEVTNMVEAQRACGSVLDSTLVPSAVQIRAGESTRPRVDILFEGTRAGIDAQLAMLSRVSSARFDDSSDNVWQARQDLWNDDGPCAILKIATLPSEIGSICERVERTARDAGVSWRAVFYATGIGTVRFAGTPCDWPARVAELRGSLEPIGGSAVVLKPFVQDAGVDVWGHPSDAQPLMQAVKQQFDPNGTLNPGVFVGGI